MTNEDDLAQRELVEQMREEAERRGIDPSVVHEEDIHVTPDNSNIRIKWRDIEISLPAPPKEAVSNWIRENGQGIAASLFTIAGVVVTGALSIAAASILGAKVPRPKL